MILSRTSRSRSSTRLYAMFRLIRIFFTLFYLVPYSAFSIAFVDAGLGSTGSGPAISKTFLFLIDVLTSPPPSSFVLSYAVVNHKYSENCPTLFSQTRPVARSVLCLSQKKPPSKRCPCYQIRFFFCLHQMAPSSRSSHRTFQFSQAFNS